MMSISMPMITFTGVLIPLPIAIIGIVFIVAWSVVLFQLLMIHKWPSILWNIIKRTYHFVRSYRSKKRESYNTKKDAENILKVSKRLNS